MSLKSALGKGAVAAGNIIGIALAVVAVVTLFSIVGGLVGAGIALGYNVLLGVNIPILWVAVVGSVVAVLSGALWAVGEVVYRAISGEWGTFPIKERRRM